MTTQGKLDLASLDATFDKVPFAITLSDLAAEDQPLIFFNEAFRKMTGCGPAHLGQNCRFLQAELENTEARAEIRQALADRRRTQVVLENRRMDGSRFHNLLQLEPIGPFGSYENLALGTQFVLSEAEREMLDTKGIRFAESSISRVRDTALRTRLDQRRVAAASAVQVLRSWEILNTISARC